MPPAIYQLKVSLVGIRPEIWRHILVPADINLEKLHKVLQLAMGWEDYHLYGFFFDGVEYGDPATDEYGTGVTSARRARLASLIDRPGDEFTYRYDFGDDWEHRISLERVPEAEPGNKYPLCLDGARACPPEDCGGIYGYEELLEALRDPQHEEHEHLLDWVGGHFDAEAFDASLVNARLSRARLARVPRSRG